MDWIGILLAITLYVGLPVVLFTGWRRWARRPPEQSLFVFLSMAGFTLGTASALLAAGSVLYAVAIGGFSYYAPALLRIYKIGILVSLGGIALGIGGIWKRSTLRWHAAALPFGMLVLWVLWASGE